MRSESFKSNNIRTARRPLLVEVGHVRQRHSLLSFTWRIQHFGVLSAPYFADFKPQRGARGLQIGFDTA